MMVMKKSFYSSFVPSERVQRAGELCESLCKSEVTISQRLQNVGVSTGAQVANGEKWRESRLSEHLFAL